ncbi:CobD/CbiB family protein [Chitinivorax sp. B]|uniref:CobD/CbiB family protein n=1 Tax=Chitinivorax sp. B TaxID=2502235 RepID=UPI0032D59785
MMSSIAMSLLSLIAALLLEQFKPLEFRNEFMRAFTRFANKLERKLNAGEYKHGLIAWLIATVPACGIAVGVYYLLMQVSPVLAWIWNVIVLYMMIGFRHFSHAFSGISDALKSGDADHARQLLADWTNQHTTEMDDGEVSRLAIEQGLIDSYRHVFGTIFWFLILPGPAGAVLYRFATRLAQKWGGREGQEADQFGRFATMMVAVLDWAPIRLTSISFAIVGDFEDAVYCWRSQAQAWANYDYGILLASGAGAIGIKLGEPLHQDNTLKFRPELGIGDEADADYLASAVGLVWRAVLLWLFLILLFSVTHWVG